MLSFYSAYLDFCSMIVYLSALAYMNVLLRFSVPDQAEKIRKTIRWFDSYLFYLFHNLHPSKNEKQFTVIRLNKIYSTKVVGTSQLNKTRDWPGVTAKGRNILPF